MMQVKNRACVRTVAVRSLRAFKMRNLIAVVALMLTTMLFTALFTIAISINDSFQQSNFLMAGGDAHGSFKKLTEEQFQDLIVVSYNEIDSNVELQSIGMVTV